MFAKSTSVVELWYNNQGDPNGLRHRIRGKRIFGCLGCPFYSWQFRV